MIPPGEPERRPWYRHVPRGALFPLVIIVLLIYLASQTLLPTDGGGEEIVYSDAKRLIRESAGDIDLVTFRPKTRALTLTMEDGRELETNYPSDESAVALE